MAKLPITLTNCSRHVFLRSVVGTVATVKALATKRRRRVCVFENVSLSRATKLLIKGTKDNTNQHRERKSTRTVRECFLYSFSFFFGVLSLFCPLKYGFDVRSQAGAQTSPVTFREPQPVHLNCHLTPVNMLHAYTTVNIVQRSTLVVILPCTTLSTPEEWHRSACTTNSISTVLIVVKYLGGTHGSTWCTPW